MNIAITADVHLQSGNDDRKEAFRNLLARISGQGVGDLIVAGDFLDKSSGGYKEADEVAGDFPGVNIVVIAGNHDPILTGRFSQKNIEVISEPVVREYGNRRFLLLPYREGEPMVKSIDPFAAKGDVEEGRWILVSHGDYEGYSNESGNEQGYFVLTGTVIRRYQPAQVFLGHIHVPQLIGDRLYYPGSPYPLDVTEQGERRVLVYNSDSGVVESIALDYGPVYLHVDILMIPDGSENEQIRDGIRRRVDELVSNSTAGESLLDRTEIRVRLHGYTTSRKNLKVEAKKAAGEAGVGLHSILIDDLSVSDDVELGRIAVQTKEEIGKIELNEADHDELKKLVLEKAYEIIYGRG